MREELVENKDLTHTRTHEYGSYIMEAMKRMCRIRSGQCVKRV